MAQSSLILGFEARWSDAAMSLAHERWSCRPACGDAPPFQIGDRLHERGRRALGLSGGPRGRRADFSAEQPNAPHDLGRNGTYLVMRQLEQDVCGYWAALNAPRKLSSMANACWYNERTSAIGSPRRPLGPPLSLRRPHLARQSARRFRARRADRARRGQSPSHERGQPERSRVAQKKTADWSAVTERVCRVS